MQHMHFLLLDNGFAMHVAPIRVPLLVLNPELLVLNQLLLPLLEGKVVIVKGEAAALAHAAGPARKCTVAARRAVRPAGCRVRHRLECALIVKFTPISALFDLLDFFLLPFSLLVEPLGSVHCRRCFVCSLLL